MDFILQCLTFLDDHGGVVPSIEIKNKALRNFSSFNWNRMSFKRFFYVIMTRRVGEKERSFLQRKTWMMTSW